MSPRFETWERGVNDLPRSESAFEKWLFVGIAGVLFGGKPGELLRINAAKYGLAVDDLTARMSLLSETWGFSFIVVYRCDPYATIVIYNTVMTEKALSEVSEWALNELGYPGTVGPEEFLNEIGQRWQNTGKIPHEIGLTLGYPVKDVLGYMGLLSARCTGTCGWRIYGDPAPSLSRGRRYVRAKRQAVDFLSS